VTFQSVELFGIQRVNGELLIKKQILYFRMNVCVRKILRKLNDSNIRQG